MNVFSTGREKNQEMTVELHLILGVMNLKAKQICWDWDREKLRVRL